MSRTRKLLNVVYILILLNITYIFIFRHEQILNYINDKITHMKAQNVIIPQEVFNQNNYDFDTVETTTNFEPHDVSDLRKIYYTVLNNGWTSFTFYCTNEYETCLEDVESIGNSSDYLTLINNYVSPYNAYKKYNTLISGNEIYLSIDKLYTSEQILELQDFVDKTIKDLGINIGNPTVDDIRKIHDYLLERISYDTDYEKNKTEEISNNAYGAINNGLALCSGYTDTFNLFLDKLNIPNFKVTTEKHVWTAVYFNDKWSHIALTWDDDEINRNNNHNFFMISTEDLLKKDKEEHSFNQEEFLEFKK